MARATRGEWIGEAWRRHLSGESVASIGRDLKRDERTVAKALREHAAALQASRTEAGVDPLAFYTEGLLAAMRRAWALASDDRNKNAAIASLKLYTECHEKLALALGVRVGETNCAIGPPMELKIHVVATEQVA